MRKIRNWEFEIRTKATAIVVLLLLSTSLHAQAPDIRTSTQASTHNITLADWVQVTVTIEGPAPLRVEVPKQLLADEANAAWRIKTDKTTPTITPLANGREEWKQIYLLNAWPTLSNTTPPIAFAPFTVNGQSKTFDPIKMTVNRIGGPSAPAMPTPQPITPIEDTPIIISPPPKPNMWLWIAGAGLGGVLVSAVVAWMRARKPKPVPPTERALAELAKLESSDSLGAEAVECVADVLRTFIQRRFAIPATKLTTTELLAAVAQQGWSVEETDSLRIVLDECDRVKFAGDLPDNDGCRRLVRLAVDWINHISRPVEPR